MPRPPEHVLEPEQEPDLPSRVTAPEDRFEVPASNRAAMTMLSRPFAEALVQGMINRGQKDENVLTNTAFFFTHPWLKPGQKLQPGIVPGDHALAEAWRVLRDEMVRPLLAKAAAAQATTTATPAAPAPAAPAPAGTSVRPPSGPATAQAFLDTHRALLGKLGASDAELIVLLDAVLAAGAGVDVEYHAYNYTRPKPHPLAHRLFLHRHPDVDPLTSLPGKNAKPYAAIISSWGRLAEQAGGWQNMPVTEAHWEEIKKIRSEIAYPFMRIVLPRIRSDALPANAAVGDKIAHRAQAYLGVRYELGGSYQGTDPDAGDPATEAGSSLDCSALVTRVLKDLSLKWTPKSGSGVSRLRSSQDFLAVEEEPLPGDLLFRGEKHVGIYVGGGMLIEAPHTGRVVSKVKYDASKWDGISRYQPPESSK